MPSCHLALRPGADASLWALPGLGLSPSDQCALYLLVSAKGEHSVENLEMCENLLMVGLMVELKAESLDWS